MTFLRFALLGFLAILVLGTVLIDQLTPDSWSVERTQLVQAPPAAVAEFATELRNWPKFLPPDVGGQPVKYDFNEPTRGQGARMKVSSAGGDAELVLTRLDPEHGLDYEVRFPQDAATVFCALEWTADSTGTRVTLRERSAIGWNPIPRLLRGVIERGFGQEVGKCLERLKVAVAPAPQAPIKDG